MASPSPERVELAARLRRLREDTRLTQELLASAFARETPVRGATISSWENQKSPTLPTETRIEAYARLLPSGAEGDGRRRLVARPDLTPEEIVLSEELHAELTRLRDAARSASSLGDAALSVAPVEPPAGRFWLFQDDGPVTIICPEAPKGVQGPLANAKDPNYTQTHGFADLDAVIEIYGHIRAENQPTLSVIYKSTATFAVSDLSGHLVIIGGIGWNRIQQSVMQRLQQTQSVQRMPVEQVEVDDLETGEIFQIGRKDGAKQFRPQWTNNDDGELVLTEDVGLLARVRNPYNSQRTLTICNGIHSRGVLGAVRTLTDARLADANEAFLAEHFSEADFALLIKVPVIEGFAIGADLVNEQSILYSWSSPRDSSTHE